MCVTLTRLCFYLPRASQEFLRKKGLASAEKKASRAAKEGIIETYIHTGAKLGVMVEVNCETDFVAKRPEFSELAKAVAMQIAASPTVEVVSEADISPEFIEREKKIEAQSEDLKGKPEQIVEKIVAGRIQKILKTKLLLEQPYIRDPSMNVDECAPDRPRPRTVMVLALALASAASVLLPTG